MNLTGAFPNILSGDGGFSGGDAIHAATSGSGGTSRLRRRRRLERRWRREGREAEGEREISSVRGSGFGVSDRVYRCTGCGCSSFAILGRAIV